MKKIFVLSNYSFLFFFFCMSAGYILVTGGIGFTTSRRGELLELLSTSPLSLRIADPRLCGMSACSGVLNGTPYVFGSRARFPQRYISDGLFKFFQHYLCRRLDWEQKPLVTIPLEDKLWTFCRDMTTMFHANGLSYPGPVMPMVLDGQTLVKISDNQVCVFGLPRGKSDGETWFINTQNFQVARGPSLNVPRTLGCGGVLKLEGVHYLVSCGGELKSPSVFRSTVIELLNLSVPDASWTLGALNNP